MRCSFRLNEFEGGAALNELERATSEGKRSRKGMSIDEANAAARRLAKCDIAFVKLPIREWAKRIGCTISTVSKTALWQEVMRRSGRGRVPGGVPKTVSLTENINACLGEGRPNEVLDQLIAEQEADFEPSPVDSRDRQSRRVKSFRK
jgi:hypothetical protein